MEKSVAQMRAELRDFYFNKVKPVLTSLNAERRKNTICICSFVILLSTFFLRDIIPYTASFLFIAASVICLNCCKKGQSIKQLDFTGEEEFKNKFMVKFLDIFSCGMIWSKTNFRKAGADFKVYKNLNIMNPFFILSFDDMLCGIYKGVKFNILECNTSILSVKNLLIAFSFSMLAFSLLIGFSSLLLIIIFLIASVFKSFEIYIVFVFFLIIILLILWKLLMRVPFHGVFIEFDVKKNFEGHTFLFERAVTNRSLKIDTSKFQEVKLEDPEFSSKYIVYSDNQVEARYVLTTAFIERFKNMKTAFRAKYIRAAFKDGKITIAIHSGRDLFAMANLIKDTDSNTFAELFDEILSVLGLIETLKLNQKIGL